ncbi:MAG: multifunctional CCA addition/repair protein [Chromatiales bacterium]|jgi:tRNA nucleotidyltransferase (CCA-adding enzyme)
MRCYLVGGAVRDGLLGLEPRERDWLVTETTREALLAAGFREVGRDFPVFLHPDTGEQHALPRGGGDSVEEDLCHRDLTVNAMAVDEGGRLIDPCGGQADLRRGLLRHTPHFTDDPLRVLRLARFAARYHELGFSVAPETAALARRVADSGALPALPPERLWGEIAAALQERHARVFFATLRSLHALAEVLPELDALFGVPQPERYHPEIDTGEHSLMVLEQACRLSRSPRVRFAALTHDLGKGATPPELWPRHPDHGPRGAELVRALSARLRVPNDWRDLACAVAVHHDNCHRLESLRPATVLRMLEALDALRRPQRAEELALASEADARGRTGREHTPYPQRGLLAQVLAAARGVDAGAAARSQTGGLRIAQAVRQARLAAIRRVLDLHRTTRSGEAVTPGADALPY